MTPLASNRVTPRIESRDPSRINLSRQPSQRRIGSLPSDAPAPQPSQLDWQRAPFILLSGDAPPIRVRSTNSDYCVYGRGGCGSCEACTLKAHTFDDGVLDALHVSRG